ncbi:MAG: adenosine kinase [Bdellovibrionales bacterium]|nr:adenosine kinase [Bdellovibrionales bacterium]
MQTKDLQLCGVGNGLVDILVNIDDHTFAALGFEKASMRLVSSQEQSDLLKGLHGKELKLASGGSVANSVIAFSQLGGRAGLLTSLGDDLYGMHFQSECENLGVELPNPLQVKQTTGTAAVLVTPDAERTMRVDLGVASKLSKQHLDEELIARSEWLFLEGYLFSNPEVGTESVKFASELAKRYDTKIALTFSESWVVESFREDVKEVALQADLIFANEHEAQAFTGRSSTNEAFADLMQIIPGVVVTAGAKGAYVSFTGEQHHVDAFPCDPLDLTGAGDMFAAAFLYGLCHDISVKESARAGCFLAREVITQVGARLHKPLPLLWQTALKQV